MLLPYIKLFKKTKKGLELVSLSHFPHDLLIKMFFLLYSINWPNFIVWLSLHREILGNLCIVIVCWPGCDVISLEIHLIFPIKPFFPHDQKIKIKTYKKSFSVAKNCLRPETALLTILSIKTQLSCSFEKNLKGCHFMEQNSTGLKFSITTDL